MILTAHKTLSISGFGFIKRNVGGKFKQRKISSQEGVEEKKISTFSFKAESVCHIRINMLKDKFTQ